MPRARHKLLVTVFALATFVALALATAFALISRLPRFGPGFDPLVPSGLAQLEGAAENGRHLARALSIYRTQRGRFPDNLTALLEGADTDQPFHVSDSGAWIPGFPQSDTERWNYLTEDPHSCVIWRKLGADSSVEGRCGADGTWVWRYDPGDGSPDTRLPW